MGWFAAEKPRPDGGGGREVAETPKPVVGGGGRDEPVGGGGGRCEPVGGGGGGRCEPVGGGGGGRDEPVGGRGGGRCELVGGGGGREELTPVEDMGAIGGGGWAMLGLTLPTPLIPTPAALAEGGGWEEEFK